MKLNPRFKNALAVGTGILVGSFVNMAIISISDSVIPPPTNIDVSTTEGLKAAMHLFQPKHFLFPFMAHAFGTFVGAMIATKIALTHQKVPAMLVGIFFLFGGITTILMLPSPLWFAITDIIGAYLPMAYLGWKIIQNKVIS